MWLSDFDVVLKDRIIKRGSLRIEDGIICEIRHAPVENGDIQGEGRLLLPGFIDLHGDMIEKKIEPRPNVRMPLELGILDLDRELASCGVTTAYAALAFTPTTYGQLRSVENTMAAIGALADLRGSLLVDHRVHARFEVTFPTAVEVLEQLAKSGVLKLISLMDHTPGQGQYRNLEIYIANLAKGSKISEADAATLVRERMAAGFKLEDALERIQALAETASTHNIVIASHDDDTIDKVRLMHEMNAVISEFPITLEAAAEAKRLGMLNAMGAPNALRGKSYSGNLSARDACSENLLDILVSDYHPSSFLPAIVALSEISEGGLPEAVALASANPARAVGLSDRGMIAEGMRADLVVAEQGRVPRPRATFRGGRIIWSDGMISSNQITQVLAAAE